MSKPSPCFVCGHAAEAGYDHTFAQAGIKVLVIRCGDPGCSLRAMKMQFSLDHWERLCKEAEEHKAEGQKDT